MNDAGYSLADIRAVTADNDGMGFGGGWFWLIVILLFGGFNRNNYGESPLVSDEFIKRDIFNTNQNISSTACQTQRDVIEAKYDTELSIANLASQMQNCCCETNRNVDSVKYDTLLNFKDMQAQLSACCCDLKTAIHAEGEATRRTNPIKYNSRFKRQISRFSKRNRHSKLSSTKQRTNKYYPKYIRKICYKPKCASLRMQHI